jgi:serine phosphatase RsbU (regulator of sigma subunit)
MKSFGILCVFTLFLSLGTFSQRPNDLWSKFQNESLHDTIKLQALGDYIWNVYLFNNTDSAFYFIDIMEDYAEKKKQDYYVLEALNRRGIAYAIKGQNRVAVSVFEEGVRRASAMAPTRRITSMIANFHNNLGNVFSGIGDTKNAVKSYRNSLRTMEKLDNKAGIGNSYHNLAVIFAEQKDHATALSYYNQARKNHLAAENKIGYANGTQSIGSLYSRIYSQTSDKAYLDSAKMYLDSAIIYFTELGQKLGLANVYNNLSSIAGKQDQLQVSIEYNEKALELYRAINNATGITTTYSNLAEQYLEVGKVELALSYANEAVEWAKKSDQFTAKKAANQALMLIYRQRGNYKKALEIYEEIVALNDSIVNSEMKSEILLNKFEYEMESARLKDSLERLEERRIHEQQIELQQVQIENDRVKAIGLYSALAFALLFTGFVYNRLKISQRQQRVIENQKIEVEYQKQIVDHKNQEILDSINYSKRLQEAILPKKVLFEAVFSANFILYKPKDIVSGDFYWLEETPDYYFLAAADCTGHGVPGAMVSFVCSSALSKSVKEDKLSDCSKILDRTRELVKLHFGRGDSSINDGMDLALIRVSKSNKREIQFSGANNSLWLLRNDELIQFKADKQHIGQSSAEYPFTHQEIETDSGDELFLFTDGYPDQFGGPAADEHGKKFKIKRLKEILTNESASFHEKESLLNTTFEQWKGNREQTDDVLVIGLRLD